MNFITVYNSRTPEIGPEGGWDLFSGVDDEGEGPEPFVACADCSGDGDAGMQLALIS